MTIYFHPKSLGFYDTRVHGERRLRVVDPDWQQGDLSADAVNSNLANALHFIEVLNLQCTLPVEQELIEISQGDYDQLIEAQSRGEVITVEAGKPAAAKFELSVFDQSEVERLWRDKAIGAATWLRERHRDELDLQRPTTLSGVKFAELLDYLQRLRDWPQAGGFPDASGRPIAPLWIGREQR